MQDPGSKDKSIVDVGFLTAYPSYPSLFPEILRVLLSRNLTPEHVELGEAHNFKLIPFDSDRIADMSKMWHKEGRPGWLFKRRSPVRLDVWIGKTFHEFEPVSIQIDRKYFHEPERVDEFIGILEELYRLLHPAYGDVRLPEMVKEYDGPLGKVKLGTDLERALPDLFWANFLGPEYVEMVGPGKISSAPCHRVEKLPDGGALLVLSPSPLDFLRDSESFEKTRSQLKAYLGEEAFDIGWPTRQGKVPKFRYLEERRKEMATAPLPVSSEAPSDWFSSVSRAEWERWVKDNQSIALDFVREMKNRGINLNFSQKSIRRLDSFVEGLEKTKAIPTLELLKKLGAYVSQVLVRETRADWVYPETRDIPTLMVSGVEISPLARALKVVLEGDRFEPWYRFLRNELIPAVKNTEV